MDNGPPPGKIYPADGLDDLISQFIGEALDLYFNHFKSASGPFVKNISPPTSTPVVIIIRHPHISQSAFYDGERLSYVLCASSLLFRLPYFVLGLYGFLWGIILLFRSISFDLPINKFID